MGRSKFPGKPSKHVNRTRINVLCTPLDATTVGDTNNVVTVQTEDSKQVNSAGEPPQEKQKSDCVVDKQISKSIPRKKQRTRLVNKRTTLKRNGMLPSVSSKLTSINQVPRRTRSGVTGRRAIRNFSSIRKVSKPKHTVSPTKESNNLVGKFVLPSRSVHSSRVIKPNKRFINVESNEARSFKKRVVNKRICIRETEEKCPPDKNSVKENADNETSETGTVYSKGRVVLRQARLQLHSQSTSSGSEGPFSSNISNTVSPPGTVTCGVCGAVRFYRFVKQARKFNIYSCESCRKFISKMIKRQQSNLPVLQCHKGQGMCHVPPIVRSQQWKLFRCAYKARCPACWLKMCLRSFQMPTALKNSLAQLLPKHMQTCDPLFSNPLPLLSWQSNVNNSTAEKPMPITKQEPPEESNVRRRPVRLKAVKRDTKSVSVVHTSEIKRQKVDLKGPRVKHVCRSASIVLGQPIATFPVDNTKRSIDAEEKIEIKKIAENKEAKTSLVKENLESNKSKIDDDTSSNSSSSEKQNISVSRGNCIKSDISIKKERNIKAVTISNIVMEAKPVSYIKKNIERCNTISIDFWENYDPDEICMSGFGLTSSEMFPMHAICFLCGSAGQETLLHCLICCEPYHSYCLEQAPANFIEYNEKYNWLCPRCTTCEACGQADRQKINCMKCHKAYHPNCFNTLWKRDDKPTLCSNCLRCKSCGSESIAKFVGNFALCHVCFKLRNKGNYCPLCQKCYDDNDFEIKMMECGKCRKWVHAKCETLADEQYQILSLLPESVEFLCNRCCNQSTPFWREAIQNELKSSFNNVLKLLSKNRTARNMLKLSPYKNNNSNVKPAMSVRKIQFQDDEGTDINENKEPNGKLLTRRLSFESQDSSGDVRQESKSPVSSIIVDIKNKLNSNEYVSLQDFNTGMEHALEGADSEELLRIYRTILKEVFPWYDPTLKDENVDLKKSPTECPVQPQSSLFDSIKLFDYDMGKDKDKVDNRVCGLCKVVGDGLPHKEARLLYCGQNEWVHANCALWSSEVYEEIDGSLQNVHSALSRGRLIKCAHCKQKGASVGCCEKGCHETYHFACALNVNCHFLHDKTVYCHSHELTNKNLLTSPSDFDIRRSVYVELDRKRKKYSEPDKVHFMVGSLSVTSLGKIIPILSDDPDALVPLGFTCTRLFWSTSEPWKLIPYYIRTSVFNSEINSICIDKNFTVDHSLPKTVVDKKLKEILLWQRDLLKDALDLDFEEEPQNTADLLTPELTDAIFEELPHDFLDGISVQDVLMYEELLNMDFKSEINYNDNNLVSHNEQSKKTDGPEEVEVELKSSRELKRSKSEVLNQFGNVDKLNKNRSHQRSCSLTWSCKLDNSLTPTIKKRKIASRDNNMYLQLLQVDGAYDSSSSECGSPVHETEDLWSYETTEEPVSCERCQCTYRTRASYKRHLATCDALSTSESDSEEQGIRSNDPSIYVNVAETGEPNVIAAYESFSSYQATQNEVHSTIMNTQTLVTAEATSEVIAVPENAGVLYPTFQQQVVEQKTATLPVITHDISPIPAISVNQPQPTIEDMQPAQQQATFCINQQPICVNQSNTLSLNHAGLISLDNPISINPIAINQSTPISINQNATLPLNQVEIQQPVAIQSLPFTSEVTPLINLAPQNQITIDAKMLTAPCTNLVNSVVAQTMAVPQTSWVKPVVKSSVITQKAIRPRAKPRSLAAKRGRIATGNTIIMPPSSGTTPVIVQHLSSSNMVPTFVDAFQQQSGQNLQYVTAIAPQINSAITPQTQLVQIQPDNNFLSLVPGVQPTMIIQQPRVVTDQLIVDGSGSMMWTTQPVYYGFETIVQNTVMQSQQFLPTTMNGVLTTNSSYSATTQVFQTSKLEPVLDVAQGGFVLVNSGQIVNSPAIQVPQISQNVQTTQNLNNTHIPAAVTQHNNNKVQSWNQVAPITAISETQVKPQGSLPTTTNNLHSITLPLAPFVPEQGIPTNIVTPTPKPPASAQSRPMSRVLPMQTNLPRDQRKIEEKIVSEKPLDCAKETAIIPSFVKPKITILENEIIKEANEIIKEKITTAKAEHQIKLTIPTPVEKIGSNIPAATTNNTNVSASKLPQPIQVASLKPIVTEIINPDILTPELEEKIECPPALPCLKANEESVPFTIPELPKAPTPLCVTKLPQEKLTTNLNPPNLSNNFPKNSSSILYTVETRDGFRYSSTSIYELWSKVFETVQEARAAHSMPPLPANALDKINNLQLLGLKSNGLRYLLEQLPGASKCTKYKPSFYTKRVQDDSDDEIDIASVTGSIRTVPYVRKKEPYDMFGWLASKHRKPENCVIDSDLLPRRGSVTNLPMAMRFRQLKLTSKVSVGVYRSNIHRRGLFSLRDIESGEMVIEYAGEVIRSVLTDKREKYYNSKGIGCYMFRIDDNLVVDATMKGNAARFINHSCDPNCYSKVVEIHGHKHIIIFALRRILCGEELTYDYKFPFEEDKIPCTCGARRCRKFLN